MTFTTRARSLVVILTGCILALLGAGLAVAVTSADEIHACALKPTGYLRRVSDPRECRRSEELVSWNREGPQGPPGPPGAGTALTYRVAREDIPFDSSLNFPTTGSIRCQADETLVGGGWETEPLQNSGVGKEQIERDGQTYRPVAYSVVIYPGAKGILRIHAVCVSSSP
jgi:hypothetical protein